MLTTQQIKELVAEIIQANSGGMKFLELTVRFAEEASKRYAINLSDIPDFHRVFEQYIRNMPELKILDYGYQMTSGVCRGKMFVYTPLPERKEGEKYVRLE